METQDSHCVHKSRQQIKQIIDRARVTWWCRWLRHCATSRKGTSSIPHGVIELSRPQGAMALGSTQPLTEMKTRSISCG